jgi:hypothetical protein
MARRIVLSQEVMQQLHRGGLIPDNCQRIVIDLTIGEPARVFYQCLGDERMLQVNLPEALADAVVVHVVAKGDWG